MTTIRKLQLEALDDLGRKAAAIGTALDQLGTSTNDFDIEARVYTLIEFGKSLSQAAHRIHVQMHAENSAVLRS